MGVKLRTSNIVLYLVDNDTEIVAAGSDISGIGHTADRGISRIRLRFYTKCLVANASIRRSALDIDEMDTTHLFLIVLSLMVMLVTVASLEIEPCH